MKKIKIFIMIIVAVLTVISFSYGVANATGGEASGGGNKILGLVDAIISIFESVWLVFAILAGKLFTNDFVYGYTFHMNDVLKGIWEFSRALANYIIGFTFIVGIFLYFLGKLKSIFDLLGKIVIASILVNASWFIVAVLVDLSTILIAGVGAMPMRLISTSHTPPIQKIKYCSQIELNQANITSNMKHPENITVCKPGSEKEINASDFFSKMADMTGPLIYIGTSVLNLDKNRTLDVNQVEKGSDIQKGATFRRILHMLVVVMFVLPIILLVIIGVIRVFWLWIYIGFSPLLILDYVFGSKYLGSKKQLKIANVIGLIFQPVLVVLAMGVSLIFLSVVQSSFIAKKGYSQAKEAIGICNEDRSLCINEKPVVTVNGNLMKNFMKDVGGFLGYIIIMLITLALIWGVLKLALLSNEMTSGVVKATIEFVQEGLKAVPIIPTKKGGVGLGALQMGLKSSILRKSFDVQATEQASGILKKIDDVFGIGGQTLGPAFVKEIEESMKIASNVQKLLASYKKVVEKLRDHHDIIPASNTDFRELVYTMVLKLQQLDNKSSIGLPEEVKNILKENISDEQKIDKLFNSEFGSFLTASIQNPGSLDISSNNFSSVYGKLKKHSNLLNASVKVILGKNN